MSLPAGLTTSHGSRCDGEDHGRKNAVRQVLWAEGGAFQRYPLLLPGSLQGTDSEVREVRSRLGRQAEVIRPLCLGLLILLAGPVGAATVLSVGDGDTIRVSERGRRLTIRLACIDAPEMAQKPFGAGSRRQLQELAPVGSEVALQIQATDKYGRTVAEVFAAGQNLNLQMVRSGQAFAYRKYLGACDREAYLGAERQAEAARVGLWAVPGGIERPWEFRKNRRRKG
jgi:endonuclease YncB( thermonuclease family)